MLRFAGQGILIVFALAACVTCMKTRQAQSPMGLARELHRNLSIVNIATRRRAMPQRSRRVTVHIVAVAAPQSPTG